MASGRRRLAAYQLTFMHMHYRLLVTTRAAKTSLQARRHVFEWLYQNGFVTDPARRWSGAADWLVIGGRFTGALSSLGYLVRGLPQDDFGCADDAKLVTANLYEGFLSEHEGWADDNCFVDLEDEPVTPAFIGTKWLVVVDYHR